MSRNLLLVLWVCHGAAEFCVDKPLFYTYCGLAFLTIISFMFPSNQSSQGPPKQPPASLNWCSFDPLPKRPLKRAKTLKILDGP